MEYEGRMITESGITLEGQRYTGSLSARLPHPDGKPYHTFRTASLYVFGDDITFRDCTFENTAGPGEAVGQAIALYLDGDNIHLEDCTLRGYQDTLFIAPLPEKEYEKDGFLGPKQFAPRTPRRVYFKNCLIEGGIDFIFGGGTAYFEDCEFRSIEPGFVFAPSTPPSVEEGFVCHNCRFTCDPAAVLEGSCYIARPWRNDAAVTLKHCELGSHIARDGWHDWNKKEAHDTVRFVEVDSYGPGTRDVSRPSWVQTRSEP